MEIAVCDDEKIIGQQVCNMVNQITGEECCSVFENETDLFSEMEDGPPFDAVILDIEWDGEEKGIQIAKKIEEISPDTRIIYLTGYTEKYVQQIFLCPSNLSGFLMKPVDRELLKQNLQKISESKVNKEEGRLIVRQNRNTYALRCKDIYYLESDGHTVFVHMAEKVYSCYNKLDYFSKFLPNEFIQCHKSFYVNLYQVHSIDAKQKILIMENGDKVPISKMRYRETKDRFFKYIGGQEFSEEL